MRTYALLSRRLNESAAALQELAADADRRRAKAEREFDRLAEALERAGIQAVPIAGRIHLYDPAGNPLVPFL